MAPSLNDVNADLYAWYAEQEQYTPTAADYAEAALIAAMTHPTIAQILEAAREVLETDGHHGMASLLNECDSVLTTK